MISYSPSKFFKSLRRGTSDDESIPEPQLDRESWFIRHPALVVTFVLASAETLPATYYGRYLARLDPLPAALSIALSFLGTWAFYLLIVQLGSRRVWLRRLMVAGLAIWAVLVQIVYFGIYREFATLPTASVVDFVRQTPDYAWALFVDRLDVVMVVGAALVIGAVACGIRWGFRSPFRASRPVWAGIALSVVASYGCTRAPFMTFGQQVAHLIVKSSHGPGVVNVAWTPDRARASTTPAKYPVNVVVFRLEEIAAQATTLERPDLPTMPKLKALVDEHPNEVFVARQHFSNSTATDVSVLSIYTGLSPAAELETHRHTPILWDYFAAAGYDTSLFIPFHLEWGDFKRRFAARPGEVHLNKLVDAGNSGFPLVYDNSINDTDVVAAALDYQRKRSWQAPFFQIVSLKMPHAIGEGARINKLDYADWGEGSAGLKDYYNGIRHDDDLMDQFIAEMPEGTRDTTVFVVLSDHGTRLFARDDGVEELHRLDNYHQEATKVPFVVYMPPGVQKIVPAETVQALRTSLATRATSNIDFAPTLVGITGITPVRLNVDHAGVLVGRDLSRPQRSTEAIVQLNTGPLRRWDREHFGLVLDNGRYHYLFSLGRELLFDLNADPSERKNVIGDPAFAQIAASGRAVATELPELLRIQRKYNGQHEAAPQVRIESAVPRPTAPARLEPNLLRSSAEPPGPGPSASAAVGGERWVAQYYVDPPNPRFEIRAEFAVRVDAGKGLLEWRVRRGSALVHFAHIEGVEPGEQHRFSFDWQAPVNEDAPLSIQLVSTADGAEELALTVDRASAGLVQTVGAREFSLVELSRARPGIGQVIAHGLETFKESQCLREPQADACPNGFLAWGPYVAGAKGAAVSLRYDIEARRAGAKVWFDVTADGGHEQLAASRVYQISEAGSHSFELAARLDSDAAGIEGRFIANGGKSLEGYGLTLRGAELTLAGPAAP